MMKVTEPRRSTTLGGQVSGVNNVNQPSLGERMARSSGHSEKGPVVSTADGLTWQIGAVIGRERASRGMSIAQLAATSGVSAGLLSQLERGIANPSIETVANIARALNLSIGAFFEGSAESSDVVHPHTRKKLALSDRKVAYELLVPDLQGALSMLYINLPAKFSNEQSPFMHSGEEVIFVQEGKVTIHLGNRSHDLADGDSIRFSSATQHWYQVDSKPVVIISAMTPPSF
jgi:transcriptional regulator with XRE-family HTH domain